MQFLGHLIGSSVVGLMVTPSKRAYATHCVTQVCHIQSPCSCGRTLLICTSAGDTQTIKGRSGSVSVGSLVYGVHKVLLGISGGYEVWFQKQFRPSYHLTRALPLPLDVGYLFLVGSNILLLMVVQQQVVILEFSQEEINACPSTLPSTTS